MRFETQPHFALPEERNSTDPEPSGTPGVIRITAASLSGQVRHHNAKLREHGSRRAEVGGIVIPGVSTTRRQPASSDLENCNRDARLVGWHRDAQKRRLILERQSTERSGRGEESSSILRSISIVLFADDFPCGDCQS